MSARLARNASSVRRSLCAVGLLVALALAPLMLVDVASATPYGLFDTIALADTDPADTTPPVTTAIGVDDLWHNAPVTITFSATDNLGGSGVAQTEYQLDGGSWITGTSLTVAAPADHGNDGEHVVSYRSTDAAGNVEAASTAVVLIDTQAPDVAARSGSDNREYPAARVRYAIDEGLSPDLQVRVTIIDAAGVALKTLDSTREPDANLSTRFRCDLRPGAYRCLVQATDQAGNVGSAWGKLAVYVWWRDADKYRGQTKTVLGPVKSTKYASTSSGRPTFLNIGQTYPRTPRLTAVIWGRDRRRFDFDPEISYRGRLVTVRARIMIYQGQPQLFVNRPLQIRILW